MWNESPLATIRFRQGPFARPALTGFVATMNPSDSRSRPNHSYLFPWPVVAAVHTLVTPRRVSQVPRLVCQRPPPPTTPGSSTAAIAHCFAVDTRLRHLWQVGHSQQRNEAESGSLALRLTPSSHGASVAGSPRHPPDRLHGERAITMVSSFQLTRPARLCLAHQSSQRSAEYMNPACAGRPASLGCGVEHVRCKSNLVGCRPCRNGIAFTSTALNTVAQGPPSAAHPGSIPINNSSAEQLALCTVKTSPRPKRAGVISPSS